MFECTSFTVKTGLLMEQLLPLLEELQVYEAGNRVSFSSKAMQLMKRRRQRQARRGLVKKSLSRKTKLARLSVNKRKLTLRKANRKRNLTKRVFRPRKHK